MKKIFFFAVLAVALAGYGVSTGIANAQTVTSSQVSNAALEQELQVAKATLINLETQQGMVPQGDDQLGSSAAPVVAQTQPTQTQATTGLSVSQISAFENTLATLVGTLSQLNATLNANPNMDASQIAAIETTLNGMQGTVVAMANGIATDEAASPIAMTSPAASTPSTNGTPASAPAQVAQTAPTPVSAPTAAVSASVPATSANAPAAVVATNPVQATAQASSIWSFTKSHWPAIVIILLVIVILAILFWPESGSDETVTTMTSQKTVTTKAPAATVTPSMSATVAPAPMPPSQAVKTQETRTTVITASTDTTKIA
jgi:hypothetical protein